MRSLTPEQLTKIDGKKYVSTNANVKTILQNSVFAQDLADSQAITSVLYIDDTIDVGTVRSRSATGQRLRRLSRSVPVLRQWLMFLSSSVPIRLW